MGATKRLEPRAWTASRLGQTLRDIDVDRIGIALPTTARSTRTGTEMHGKPQQRRGAPEQVQILRNQPPGRARSRPNIKLRRAHRRQRDTVRTLHAKYIVIRRHEQGGRVGKSRIFGKPARVGMAMCADDRQIANRSSQRPCNVTQRRRNRKQPVRVQNHLSLAVSGFVQNRAGIVFKSSGTR